MAQHAVQQVAQRSRLFNRVIFAGDERPLKRQPPTCFFDVVAASVHQFSDGPAVVDGDKLVPLFIRGGVQGDGQRRLALLIGVAADGGDQSHSGNGDFARAQVEAGFVGQAVNGGEGVVVIVQRLAHAHHHNVGDVLLGLGQFVSKIKHLGHDFADGEVAEEAHLPGGAKDAAHGAARLRADTQRAPLVVAHEHRLDVLAVG